MLLEQAVLMAPPLLLLVHAGENISPMVRLWSEAGALNPDLDLELYQQRPVIG